MSTPTTPGIPANFPHVFPAGCGTPNCPECWWIYPPDWNPHETPEGCRDALCPDCWDKLAINSADAARYWLGEKTAELADLADRLPNKDPRDPAYHAVTEALWILHTCLRIWADQDPRPPFTRPDPTSLYPWTELPR
jgi:hypothetical protein